MPKTSTINRNLKRGVLVAKYAKKRAELKATMKKATTDEEFYAAQRKLAKLPRDSASVRLRNRCQITGRPSANIRKFGVCRLCFRQLALNGEIPGVTKASW